MIDKYKSKKKFVNRGVYFVTQGEYKGSFIVNIKECNVGTNTALLIFPDNVPLSMENDKIVDLFDKEHFEYVKTLPRKVYKVCLAEYKYRRTGNDSSN